MKTIQDLSIEDQFKIQSFKQEIQELNEHDTKLLLIELFKHDLIRKTAYKSMLNNQYFSSDILR